MKCPFCAEEIQDAAKLCRFCWATKQGETWTQRPIQPAPVGPPQPKGAFTFKTTAVLLIVSAGIDLVSVTSAVPLLGAVRTGVFAVLYHLMFSACFFAIGIGFWRGGPWGYKVFWGGTGLYTLDKLLSLLDVKTHQAYLLEQVGSSPEVLELVGGDLISQLLVATTVLLLLSWWGLALFVYWRRAYFRSAVPSP